MKSLSTKAIKAIALSALLLPLLTLAQQPVPQVPLTSTHQIFALINRVINIIAAVFFLVAIFVIIQAGWMYLNSEGDEGKVTEARQKLIYAAVGIAVALIAYSATSLVANFLQGS